LGNFAPEIVPCAATRELYIAPNGLAPRVREWAGELERLDQVLCQARRHGAVGLQLELDVVDEARARERLAVAIEDVATRPGDPAHARADLPLAFATLGGGGFAKAALQLGAALDGQETEGADAERGEAAGDQHRSSKTRCPRLTAPQHDALPACR
jgi:hypothetical protein